MRKHAVALILTSLELLALVLLAFFGLVMRPDLAATYHLDAAARAPMADLPTTTRLALAPWFVQTIGAVGVLLASSGWISRGVNWRNKLLGAALVWTVLGLGWAIWAAYAPAFEHLARVRRDDGTRLSANTVESGRSEFARSMIEHAASGQSRR